VPDVKIFPAVLVDTEGKVIQALKLLLIYRNINYCNHGYDKLSTAWNLSNEIL